MIYSEKSIENPRNAVLVDRIVVSFPGELVDTWEGPIASIGMPPVAGEIIEVEFWDSAAGQFISSPPEAIYGDQIGICARVRNTSDITQNMWLQHRYYDSNGNQIYNAAGVGAGVYAGAYMWLSRLGGDMRLVALKEGWPTGNYTAILELWAEPY